MKHNKQHKRRASKSVLQVLSFKKMIESDNIKYVTNFLFLYIQFHGENVYVVCRENSSLVKGSKSCASEIINSKVKSLSRFLCCLSPTLQSIFWEACSPQVALGQATFIRLVCFQEITYIVDHWKEVCENTLRLNWRWMKLWAGEVRNY